MIKKIEIKDPIQTSDMREVVEKVNEIVEVVNALGKELVEYYQGFKNGGNNDGDK